MQNNSSRQVKSSAHSRQQIKDSLKSFNSVIRNEWIIKFSIHNETNILLIFHSIETAQTIVRYFTDEGVAVDFINELVGGT